MSTASTSPALPTSQSGTNMWANPDELAHLESGASVPSASRARADVFSRRIGSVEVDLLRDHHLALAMAVIELAVDAGRPLPWSHDDPTVALLRAAAKLALTAPDASSSAAADLIARLDVGASTR